MATINDLIEQISNPQLRERVREEVSKLTKQKKFGLVYETHEPEMTLMYDAPVRVGSKVVKREYTESKITADKLLVVKHIRDGVAECELLNKEESFEMKVCELVATYTIPCSDLICIAENGEPIYPYLKPVDSVQNAPDSDLWHTLIEADNYHALQLLAYLYPGQVDCIYIDPPYNSRDKDWKYNNDYVDGSDSYRHSKWLSMMEERLKLAKKLLNPKDSVLIVTIDEKEYYRLGLLLESIFSVVPKTKKGKDDKKQGDTKGICTMQMISTVINPKGNRRDSQFSRCEEYIYILYFGESAIIPSGETMLHGDNNESRIKRKGGLRWRALLRGASNHGKRTDRKDLFYPLLFNKDNGKFEGHGPIIPLDMDKTTYCPPDGIIAMWPIGEDGTELTWNLKPSTLLAKHKKHILKFGQWDGIKRVGYYLSSGQEKMFDDGMYEILGCDNDGAYILVPKEEAEGEIRPLSVWNKKSHSGSEYGTTFLNNIIGRRFPFPKSLYAVHDTIRFFVANKPNALIVDFFAGSGTTLHAVNLLNKEDGGNRRCIMVTNNEVSAEEEEAFKAKGLHKGDEEWEKYGIARYVNWPRTKCSILGIDVNDKPLEGDYISAKTDEKVQKRTIKQLSLDLPEGKGGEKIKKQILQMIGRKSNTKVLFNVDEIDDFMENIDDATDTIYVVTADNKVFKEAIETLNELPEIAKSVPQKIPMRDGFKANAAFFKLGFLDKKHVSLGRQLKELMPLLWMKAGAYGVCPKKKDDELMVLPGNKMAVLVESYKYNELKRQLTEHPEIETVFIIEDSEDEYRNLANGLKVKRTYQLYRDYLDNFKINIKTK